MTNQSNNKRIAKNTLALYIRQIASIIISLFTVKITFGLLGETDYGINGVVCGIIALMSFLQGVMASGSQRFFSIALGKQDLNYYRILFSVTLAVYIIISLIVVIFGETIGLWIVNNKLIIPEDRMIAANWIFQFSIITMVCTLLTAPYLSSIFAYEDMGIYAKLTILDSILKLSTVCLLYFTPGDKLIISGLLALCVSILTNSFYIVYCLKHFPVCRVRPRWIKDIFKQLASFNAWNLLGQISWMAKNQGLAFILNIFYGPIVNAAQSIANNIRGLASTLGSGFGNAIKPQIMKGYVVGSREDFFTLVYRGSKMTFFLVGVITIPLLFVLSDILHIWLGEISTYMVTFTQLVLIETTFEQMSQAIGNANQATGKIASYQVLIGLAGLLNLPISYIALKWGGVPETAFVISVLLQMVIVGIRFYYLDRIQKGRFKDAITRVLFPCLFCGILAFSLCSLLEIILLTGKFFIIRGAIYFIITTTIFFFIGLTSKERIKITQFAKKKLQAI